MDKQIALLEKLARYQNKAAAAIQDSDLVKAHQNLKFATIHLFENAGANKTLSLRTSIRLFTTFFRAGLYLENESGDYAYRYEAIPGQLGNACYFQLGLSSKDASGYNPSFDAVVACASAAHSLLEQHAETIIIQTNEQRSQAIGTMFRVKDVNFAYDQLNYPIIKLKNGCAGQEIDFSQPRIFDFSEFQNVSCDKSIDLNEIEWIKAIENCML